MRVDGQGMGGSVRGSGEHAIEETKGRHQALRETIDLPVRACGSRIGHEWRRCVRISLIPKALRVFASVGRAGVGLQLDDSGGPLVGRWQRQMRRPRRRRLGRCASITGWLETEQEGGCGRREDGEGESAVPRNHGLEV